MFVAKTAFCLVFLTIGLSDAGILDTIGKCSINDGECQAKVFEKTTKTYAETGIKEFGIPPLGPYRVKDASLNVLGLTNVVIDQGTVDGMPNCTIREMKTSIEEFYTSVVSYCDKITLQGHYSVTSGPLLTSITGNALSGDGNGLIQINKMILKMKIPFNIKKHEDGKVYLVPDAARSTYSTDVKQDIKFKFEKVLVSGQNVGPIMSNFMNENWKFINDSFGKVVSDEIMRRYYKILEELFEKIEADRLFKEDLSNYVKN